MGRIIRYGDWDVPIIERGWKPAPRCPYRRTYDLRPGQHWADAAVSEKQWETYVETEHGEVLPAGAMIARELKVDGANSVVFTEIWHGLVLVGPDLVCVREDGPIGEILVHLRAIAPKKTLAGLPDVLASFSDGRIIMREAKLSRRDRLSKTQHEFAAAAQRHFGPRLDLAVVEWDVSVPGRDSATKM